VQAAAAELARRRVGLVVLVAVVLAQALGLQPRSTREVGAVLA